MRLDFNNKYAQWIEVRDGKIDKYNCECRDFQIVRLPRFRRGGKLEPCKHLVEVMNKLDFEFLEKITILPRAQRSMVGKTQLTDKEHAVLRGLVNYTCQNCFKKEDETGTLHVHRIIRGTDGGTYAPNNIRMICEDCHRKMHSGEFT